MLERQPPDVQDLLLRTSLLDRFNGELADLLTGRTGAERILLDLENADTFVESLDPERAWFRYHHLLADFLRLELRRTLPAAVPVLHRQAAQWFMRQGQVVNAVRHTQAAGDWQAAARLLADRSFSLTLDGQAQTMRALVRAYPPGTDYPELALVRALGDLAQGRLDEAAAHLSVAEAHVRTSPPDRRRRLGVAIASLRLALARRRGHLVGVIEHVRFLDSPVTGESYEDITLGSDLCAVALMNLGTAEAWALGLPDAERHLQEGAVLAREIGRPYLEVGCLAQLGFAYIFHAADLPKVDSFATTQRRCREAIALAERYGWGTEPVVAPALMTLAGTMVWLGEFDEAERWLRRTELALQTDTGPDIRLLLHQATAMLHAGRGRHHEALEEFGAAEDLASQLKEPQALASQMTGWLLATQARLGHPGEARAWLAALDDERSNSGEVRNARAVICLAEGDPAGALEALRDVLDGTAPVLGYTTVTEALPRHETAHAALLTDILDVLHGTSPAARDLSSPHPAEELSPGELRVLRYLPTNLSRPEIAGELSVSPNTVNAHIRNIYAKLQVSDRSSAVRRARELRLLAAAGRTR
jgi:LuxR family transcriptional regulator, maltose regulon positive regulatory protein